MGTKSGTSWPRKHGLWQCTSGWLWICKSFWSRPHCSLCTRFKICNGSRSWNSDHLAGEESPNDSMNSAFFIASLCKERLVTQTEGSVRKRLRNRFLFCKKHFRVQSRHRENDKNPRISFWRICKLNGWQPTVRGTSYTGLKILFYL